VNDQKLNSSLLQDTSEALGQTVKAIQGRASEYVLSDPVEYFRWKIAVEEGQDYIVRLCTLRDHLQDEEQAELKKESQ